MPEYINRHEALTIEDLSIEREPEEIELICRGMAIYADHIKSLPVETREPVLQCRECSHYGLYVRDPGEREYCDLNRRATNADGYCDRAQRRNGHDQKDII